MKEDSRKSIRLYVVLRLSPIPRKTKAFPLDLCCFHERAEIQFASAIAARDFDFLQCVNGKATFELQY